jgi:hypothetical protein
MPNKEEYQKNKEYYIEYRSNVNIKEREKQRVQQRIEIIKEYRKQYFQKKKNDPIYKKRVLINRWKHRGIIFHDYDLLYDIYLQTTHCDECKCLLNQCVKSRKCVDHDHTITDDNNVRNILCHCCNRKRG